MGKNRRKRPRPVSFPSSTTSPGGWKSLSVELSAGGVLTTSTDDVKENDDHHVEDHETTVEYTRNHYDDPELSEKAELDLPMNRGEDCAMFFGLEVLDSSQYRVEQKGTSKRLLIRKGDEEGQGDHQSFDEKLVKFTTQKKGPTQFKNSDNPDNIETQDKQDTSTTEPKKKKRKKKKKKKNVEDDSEHDNSSTDKSSTKKSLEHQKQLEPIDPNEIFRIQSSWSSSSGGAVLHNRLIESLCRLDFDSPTPIQAATLAASIMGRRNLVGAAPTGSGKTLAFLLPILNGILETNEEKKKADTQEDDVDVTAMSNNFVQALIMTPTRELATQIQAECEKLVPDQCVTLVGGIALVKQKRLLLTKKPSIVVATPGRLWAMLSSGDNDHLNDLSRIRFLVLDEADRMTQEHSFPQLVKILDSINVANPSEKGTDDDNNGSDDETDDENHDGSRMLGLPGIRGEADLVMLTDDIMNQIEVRKDSTPAEIMKLPDEYSDADDDDDIAVHKTFEIEEDIPEDLFSNLKPRVHRQTFIYSATLTLPFTSTKAVRKRTKKLGLDGGIAEILEKTNVMGETKVVDLSSSSSTATSLLNQQGSSGVRLPPGLSLVQIKCTQKHKDSHLYAYLMTTIQGASGPCLVFCNSIAAVRRVGATFQTLGFPTRMLHAHMQQRARFKAVESLKNSKKRVLVICTDVAARGLDIPSVSTVVHYDVARAVDTFVHRSGRTARGMGVEAVGTSLSLISSAEDRAHSKIVDAMSVSFEKVILDGRLLSSSQLRVNLASKIYTVNEMEHKTNHSNRWFLEMAKQADLDLDDNLVEDESNRSEKELQHIMEAKRARVQLAKLLKEPLTTQKFGKFLSTNSAAIQNQLKSHK